MRKAIPWTHMDNHGNHITEKAKKKKRKEDVGWSPTTDRKCDTFTSSEYFPACMLSSINTCDEQRKEYENRKHKNRVQRLVWNREDMLICIFFSLKMYFRTFQFHTLQLTWTLLLYCSEDHDRLKAATVNRRNDLRSTSFTWSESEKDAEEWVRCQKTDMC